MQNDNSKIKNNRNIIVKMLVAFMLGFAKSFGVMPYKNDEQKIKEIGAKK